MKPILSALCILSTLAALAFATPVRAETPTYAYVGLNCTENSTGTFDGVILLSTRLVTFRDGEEADYASMPVFPLLPMAVDHGMSAGILTLAGAKSDQAACGGPGMIVVRHGAKPWGADEDPQEWISVWVGDRKILSRFAIARDGNPLTPQLRDDALLIIGGKVSICRHDTRKAADCKPLGDVAGMGVVQNPFIEKAIAPGRIAATFARDRKLCDGLIKLGAQPGDANLPYLNKPDNRNESYYLAPDDQDTISFRDGQPMQGQPYTFHDDDHPQVVETAVFDLGNTGTPQLVVNVGNDNHYMSGSYLVGIPMTKLSPDIIKSAIGLMDALDDPKIPGALFQKGWRLYSGNDTQYAAGRYSELTAGRINGVTYVLVTSHANPKGDDSIAVLMKPSPDGSMTRMCEYHRGQPVD